MPDTTTLTHITMLNLEVLGDNNGPDIAEYLLALPRLSHAQFRIVREGTAKQKAAPIKGMNVSQVIPALRALTRLTFLSWAHDNRELSCCYVRHFAPVLHSLPSLQHLTLDVSGFYEHPNRAQHVQHAQLDTPIADPLGASIASLTELTFLKLTLCSGALLTTLGLNLPCMLSLKHMHLQDSSFHNPRGYQRNPHQLKSNTTLSEGMPLPPT